MKMTTLYLLLGLAAMLLAGCAGQEPPEVELSDETGMDEIVDFYHTYEWDGFNAEYQRYRFYVEDGRHMFFHETRKVHNTYGPATEKDVTAKGTRELTEEEWRNFLAFLDCGKLSKPEESVLDGDSGPWLYAYRQEKNGVVRYAFDFTPRDGLLAFEDFCEGLAKSA